MKRLLLLTLLLPSAAFATGLLLVSLLLPHAAHAAAPDYSQGIKDHRFQADEISNSAGKFWPAAPLFLFDESKT